jgi:hypothetical protein
MDLAYQYGVDKIWIVNVGDIKPMEFPIEFFLDMAWNPENFNARNLQDYYVNWAKENFENQFTEEIAEILKLYTKYNSRRKPELLDSKTYSITNYNEADRIVAEYKRLVEKANSINEKLKPEYKDAFYQLVLFPVLASANLNELYVAQAKNQLYAEQGHVVANDYAEKVKKLFEKDAELTNYYHTQIGNGKWNHMMSQTHIGYDNWQQPDKNVIPKTKKIAPAVQAVKVITAEEILKKETSISKKQDLAQAHGFIENGGNISIESENYSKAINSDSVKWTIISNLGKTSSGVTLKPSNIQPIEISEQSPRLEYNVHFFSKGKIKVNTYFSPTINFKKGDGLKYGIAFDNEKPQIMNLNADASEKAWAESVANNIKAISSSHTIKNSGNHVLKIYAIDSALVLQKIVIETEEGKVLESYLGPPESFRKE